MNKVQFHEGDTDHLEQRTLMQIVMETSVMMIPGKEGGCLSFPVLVKAAVKEAVEHTEELAKEDRLLRQVTNLPPVAPGDPSLLQASAHPQTAVHQAAQPLKRLDRQLQEQEDKILKRLAKSCKESLSSLLRTTLRSVH